eukprot:SAG11_NODE_1784_length_4260_cov_4.062245_1_plen_1072_part_10
MFGFGSEKARRAQIEEERLEHQRRLHEFLRSQTPPQQTISMAATPPSTPAQRAHSPTFYDAKLGGDLIQILVGGLGLDLFSDGKPMRTYSYDLLHSWGALAGTGFQLVVEGDAEGLERVTFECENGEEVCHAIDEQASRAIEESTSRRRAQQWLESHNLAAEAPAILCSFEGAGSPPAEWIVQLESMSRPELQSLSESTRVGTGKCQVRDERRNAAARLSSPVPSVDSVEEGRPESREQEEACVTQETEAEEPRGSYLEDADATIASYEPHPPAERDGEDAMDSRVFTGIAATARHYTAVAAADAAEHSEALMDAEFLHAQRLRAAEIAHEAQLEELKAKLEAMEAAHERAVSGFVTRHSLTPEQEEEDLQGRIRVLELHYAEEEELDKLGPSPSCKPEEDAFCDACDALFDKMEVDGDSMLTQSEVDKLLEEVKKKAKKRMKSANTDTERVVGTDAAESRHEVLAQERERQWAAAKIQSHHKQRLTKREARRVQSEALSALNLSHAADLAAHAEAVEAHHSLQYEQAGLLREHRQKAERLQAELERLRLYGGPPTAYSSPPNMRFSVPKDWLPEAFITETPGFACNGCSTEFAQGAILYGCRTTDFDLCKKCMAHYQLHCEQQQLHAHRAEKQALRQVHEADMLAAQIAAAAAAQVHVSSVCAALEEEHTAVMAAHCEVSSGRDHTRLVLYSSDTPDKFDFTESLKCLSMEYDFMSCPAASFDSMLSDALATAHKAERVRASQAGDAWRQRPRFNGSFRSIALACHGPPHPVTGLRPAEAAAAAGPENFMWKISEQVVVHDDKELMAHDNAVRQVIMALGHAVTSDDDNDDDGRVDLFACSLLGSVEGQEVFDMIERETGANFTASDNLTGNPKDGGDWVMESDNVDVRDMYFFSTDLFDGTFEGHADVQLPNTVELEQKHKEEKEHLIKEKEAFASELQKLQEAEKHAKATASELARTHEAEKLQLIAEHAAIHAKEKEELIAEHAAALAAAESATVIKAEAEQQHAAFMAGRAVKAPPTAAELARTHEEEKLQLIAKHAAAHAKEKEELIAEHAAALAAAESATVIKAE